MADEAREAAPQERATWRITETDLIVEITGSAGKSVISIAIVDLCDRLGSQLERKGRPSWRKN